ncbi:hypothetical protein LVB77_03710 [Lysobacter sp. 5GHs7-4]|uniref:hypothetical protein n=1 Tax=Lysobacter sp. 5GHs7-4 TaxID=2904253 RepID=UPI001E6458EE|nr:hypothetical protein [Lysobacter sp. 5GHs7-4]UHQ23829.1 hypothetical protein LVB77_03710 [Lysobacter sp. 5GHs7-4]
MTELLGTGGTSFLITVALLLLVLYAAKGINSLHNRKNQNRKEFLQMWDQSRIQDDLWLELTVRHLFGAYLPVRVIHLALAQPNKSEALRQLSELWNLFDYNPETEMVRWRNKRHATIARRRAVWRMMLAIYFIGASVAVASAVAAAHFGPGTFEGWVFGIFAIVSASVAFGNVWLEEGFRISVDRGDSWIDRINRAALRSRRVPARESTKRAERPAPLES